MGKLVRDMVPDLIRESGRTPRISTLNDVAYRVALNDKLNEEVAELRLAQSIDEVVDEAADLLEVLIAFAATQGITLDTICEAAQRKRAERGGFDMRLWLIDVDPDGDS